ncbi:MAG TPA: saccharopine dehydrogenase C-terminal domain-containing protein [Chitinophagaceae bacterium]|nr:saccharopine dehydrogenase NADP-binding domain-containing protein [Chitinophagales bacterium]HPG12830.1 saccharopine dehydrogenase C-terminal domain-containing protein [Chitinophagaceae bacterium]
MKKILLFGAGRSASVLIGYLLKNAGAEGWQIMIADADAGLLKAKAGHSDRAKLFAINIQDGNRRREIIQEADIVISLLPPALHIEVAKDCLKLRKHLLTASYTDESIQALKDEIQEANLFFLYEMGLDPGIDHMSAMHLFDRIREQGGKITSFRSHCGGLVAPESDDNPWHYKISWNSRNIVLAGKSGARYLENGEEINLDYNNLFDPDNIVEIPDLGVLGWYPNRDSIGYTSLYGLTDCPTFIRTTLRHPDFLYGWKNLIDLKLTDETIQYDSTGKTLSVLFKEHLDKNGFGDWLNEQLSKRFEQTKNVLENLMKLMDAESEAEKEGLDISESFMTADEKGNIEEVNVDEVKNKGAAFMAHEMHQANLILKQIFFLGLDDEETIIEKELKSPADILQFAMEKKLALQPDDKDMIVMLHEIGYETGNQQSAIRSSLIVKGENSIKTAMAKTVGLPLGIAAKLILNGKIKMTGLHIPTSKAIYEPVLEELKEHGISFSEETKQLS